MPRISGFSDFARDLASKIVRKDTALTAIGDGQLTVLAPLSEIEALSVIETIVHAIGEGYDFCERNFDRLKASAVDYATLVTFQVVADEMGLSQEGTAKQVQDRIFAEFHRLQKMPDAESYIWQGKMKILKRFKEALKCEVVGEPDGIANVLVGKIEDVRKELDRLSDIEEKYKTFSFHRETSESIGYARAVKSIADKLDIPSSGTEEDVYWSIIDLFHRKDQDHEDKLKAERAAGAMAERKRIEEIVKRHKKSYEERETECNKRAVSLKAELEDVERMAEEHRRDADAHEAVWSLVVISDAFEDGFSFSMSKEDLPGGHVLRQHEVADHVQRQHSAEHQHRRLDGVSRLRRRLDGLGALLQGLLVAGLGGSLTELHQGVPLLFSGVPLVEVEVEEPASNSGDDNDDGSYLPHCQRISQPRDATAVDPRQATVLVHGRQHLESAHPAFQVLQRFCLGPPSFGDLALDGAVEVEVEAVGAVEEQSGHHVLRLLSRQPGPLSFGDGGVRGKAGHARAEVVGPGVHRTDGPGGRVPVHGERLGVLGQPRLHVRLGSGNHGDMLLQRHGSAGRRLHDGRTPKGRSDQEPGVDAGVGRDHGRLVAR